jgi:predicted ATP-dependent endonuclease of OLD family
MTKPIYLDLHIHTSEDADNLNLNYNSLKLVSKIKEYNNNSEMLVSLTDHNVINKKAYEELTNITDSCLNILLGVELHIRNYTNMPPYHAHIFFNVDNIISSIDDINQILLALYPKKMVSSTDSIPSLEEIIKAFDNYDFVLLPHGGQNHSTFDKSIPKGTNFDNTLERTIYYNQFDGFTARSNTGIEETIKYFKKLNINEFINLITGTDNYKLDQYPNPKAEGDASAFIPTWMLAEATFDGLRLSLSESNRLIYSTEKPEIPSQIIKGCKLQNELIDLDIYLTSGLNVIIGESSSGKSLLIDSLYRKIANDFEKSVYLDFNVKNIEIDNPQKFHPHYINQNYIIEKINDKKINEIEIIKSLFPSNSQIKMEVEAKLQKLQTIISALTTSVKNIESLQSEIRKIPVISKLIFEGHIQINPITPFIVDAELKKKINIDNFKFQNYINILNEIEELSKNNIFMSDISSEINKIKDAINIANNKSKINALIQSFVEEEKKLCDSEIVEKNGEQARKKQQQEQLIVKVTEYINQINTFYSKLNELLKFDYSIKTQEKNRGGHKLSIINEFKITPNKIVEAINKYIKSHARITKLDELRPEILFSLNFSQSPIVRSFDDLSNKIYSFFNDLNEEKYSIITKDNKDFDKLSPGWKTAVLLDLVFCSTDDYAPLLIDQPEDNLASTYLNNGLIQSIQQAKKKRQIIIVSHNATIPMLGDAQNVIVCKNVDGKIIIRNAPLEAKIDNISIVDSVAKLTDGGKTSIKKRFKKYNLKKYRGDEDETISE